MKNRGSIGDFGSSSLGKKLLVHLASIVVVGCVFVIVILLVEDWRTTARAEHSALQVYLDLKGVELGDPVDRQLFRESLNIFFPGQAARNDSLLRAIDDLRQRQFTESAFKSGSRFEGLTRSEITSLAGMYLQFSLVYVAVLFVLYVVAERAGIYRFIKTKQHRASDVQAMFGELQRWRNSTERGTRKAHARTLGFLFLKSVGKGFVLVVLFSPAYVVAYALKTTLDTSSLVFMAALGILTNGVLVGTANRFYTLLVAESHKGYVQTAIAKGLHTSYEWDAPGGISRSSLFRVREKFDDHVFHHILLNARFQFVPMIKEHASFLVTGLVIIEMALNIQGHLCYELLQQILYRQYDVACFIVFAIFLTVKATEVAVDVWHEHEKKRYGY